MNHKPAKNTEAFRAQMRAEVARERAIARRATLLLLAFGPLIALACLYVVISGVIADAR
jgi:hypothetical protein